MTRKPVLSTARQATPLAAALTIAALLMPAAATAASSNAAAEATFRQERANCLAGRSSEDQATCLKEAGAALAEARRGTLDSGADARTLADNALLRCKRQPTADRADCERLARGEGTQQGSVKQGAVIKEIVTRTVGPVPAPTPPPATPQ